MDVMLPYFSKLLLPHNIDVMHNEKNVSEAIWNTCFDIASKTRDIAQNHGGSRNFTETQVLGLRFGPHKGTPINAFAAMKSGMRNLDSNGNCGPINSSKAQQRMDDYIVGVKRATERAAQDHEEHEDDGEREEHVNMEEVEQGQGPEHEQELNAKVLYDVSGSMTTHGCFAGYGAVRAADVRAAGKENNVSQSNPVSMQMLARQIAELRRENERLKNNYESATEQSKAAIDLTVATGSSHVGSKSTNDDYAVDGCDEDNPNDTYKVVLETVNHHSGQHAWSYGCVRRSGCW